VPDIISIHIGKTAGTAFRRVLSQVLGQENVLWDYAPYPYQPPAPLPDHICAIHGHIPARKYIEHFPDAKWIVWLRHPVFRLISEYFFAQIYKDIHNPLHVALVEKKLGLLEFAEQLPAQNIQSRQVRGKALSEFHFVGVQEFYAEDLAELRQKMEWPEFEVTAENTNPHPSYYQDLQEILREPSLIKQLAVWNQEDMELYQEALSLRAARRQESLALQYTIAGLKQSQPLIRQLQSKLQQLETQFQESGRPTLRMKTLRLKGMPGSERLLGFFIDSPGPLEDVIHESITVKGWVIGEQAKAVALRVSSRRQILTEVLINQQRPDVAKVHPVSGAEHSGFSAQVFVAGMQVGSELLLQVVLEDGAVVDIGLIRFCQSTLDT
jgi:hypothetical protein